jgi:hypothetical protein
VKAYSMFEKPWKDYKHKIKHLSLFLNENFVIVFLNDSRVILKSSSESNLCANAYFTDQ